MAWTSRDPSPPSRPVALSDLVERELAQILGSDALASAESLRRLLRFVVIETLAGRGEDIKEYSVGVSALAKEDSFDPKADPIVRVQMRRLREHLARYYSTEGRDDAIVIDIPKGRYVPVFRAAAAATAVGANVHEDSPTVGRDNEVGALRSAFDAAAAGDGRMLCLSGEPGIGKTTVVELFLRIVATGESCLIA